MKYKVIMAIALCVVALHLSGCSEIDRLIDTPPPYIGEQLEKGYTKLDSREYEKAEEVFERVLEQEEDESEARYGLSDAYIGMEKYHRAERELLKLYEEDNDKVRASIALSELYIKMEKYNKAEIVLSEQLDEDESKAELWDALIAVHEAEGEDAADLQMLYDLASLATGLPYYQRDSVAEQQKAAQEAALEATTAEETTVEETTADEVAAEETTQFETIASADQVVQFIDPVFEQFVRDAYNLPEGEIMLSDISKIRKLFFSKSGGHLDISTNWAKLTGQIKTLEDLKWFENLGEIYIDNCNGYDADASVLGSLSSIGQLPNLWRLTLSCAGISGDLSDLSQLNNLEELYISETGITGDLSSIAHLTKMTELKILRESITGDLSSLSQFSKLHTFTLISTDITGDLSSISQCTEMRHLHIEKTEISGALLNLSEMVNMRILMLGSESIVGRLSSLDKMESLLHLDLYLTSVSGDLSTLSGKPLQKLSPGANMTGSITIDNNKLIEAD